MPSSVLFLNMKLGFILDAKWRCPVIAVDNSLLHFACFFSKCNSLQWKAYNMMM
jgi:hypothetical protein